MRTFVSTLLATRGVCVVLAAQPPKAFDVASVKPLDPATSFGCDAEYPAGGGFRTKPIPPALVGGMPLGCLIALAYDVTNFEVVGGPGWLWTDLFAIEAKSAGPATQSETKSMLRTLLAERFGLAVRQEPNFKAMKWVLRMARSDARLGPGIRRADMECLKTPGNAPVSERQLRPQLPVPCGLTTASDGVTIAGGSQPLDRLLFLIRGAVGEEVIDRTGLTGLFDNYAHIPRRAATTVNQQGAVDGVSFFTAVQEELGLKLEREEVARPAVIIEGASRPTPN
jgi:uncharacterized protein (TIGR03435 family)